MAAAGHKLPGKTRQPDKENIHLMLGFSKPRNADYDTLVMDYFSWRRMTCFVSCKPDTPVNHSATAKTSRFGLIILTHFRFMHLLMK